MNRERCALGKVRGILVTMAVGSWASWGTAAPEAPGARVPSVSAEAMGEGAHLHVGEGPRVAPPVTDPEAVLALLPEEYRPAVRPLTSPLHPNATEILKAIEQTAPAHRKGLGFLFAHMPAQDAATLSAAFLVENVELAYRTRESTPWGPSIPEEIFLNDVLPYANVTEARDRFRADFHDRFLPSALSAGTIPAIVRKLNEEVFATFNVSYNPARRRRPDAGPYETIQLGFASCTGLSILLTDALRAVGVPARLAGTPQWTDNSGNHTWVEVWTGAWHFVGAAEPGELDTTWFNDKAAAADPSRPEYRIYAVSFQRTGIGFPMVWAPGDTTVFAEDVTQRYLKP